MKKLIYISLVFLQAIACKKDQLLPENTQAVEVDTVSNSNIPFSKIISSVVESTPHAINTGSYAYDDHGRLAFYITEAFTEIFTYNNDKSISIKRRYEQSLIKSGEWKALLNDKGAITSLTYRDGEGTIKSIQTFDYDSDGYMVGRKFFDQLNPAGSFEEKFYIENGLLKKKVYIVGNTPQYEINYTYGTTRMALMLQTPYATWISKTLFGKTWERVATGSQKKDLASNKIVEQLAFEYNVDQEGYVVSKTARDKQLATIALLEITY